ncbi:sugar phosphate isomerase/epimerase [Flavobacteriaceae bacterium]|nr:sugar phosphate isomerase/epimerase [Flavobacteriaceae bacterium]MDA9192734.1 sugar phosphate isomerase/epimerase [Flavobacteriaceae bacterium]
MKLSISNIAWDKDQNADVFNLIKKYKFSGIEIAPTKVFENPEKSTFDEVDLFRRLISKHQLIVPAMQSLLYGKPHLNVFNNYPETFYHLKKMIDIANILEISVLVFGSPKNRYLSNMSSKEGYNKAVSFFEEVADYALKNNVIFCIEPNSKQYDCNFINTTLEGIQIVKDVNSSGFGLHLDSAVMSLNNEDTQDSISKAIPYMKHFHISEPFLEPIINKKVNHEKISKILKNKNYDRWVSIEMKKTESNNLDIIESSLSFISDIYN